MKKLLAILLAVVVVACMFCLASCNGSKDPAKETDPATDPVTDVPTEPATEAETTDPALIYADKYLKLTDKVNGETVEGAGAKEDGSEDAVMLFDGDTATKWCQIVDTEDGTTTIQWEMKSAVKVTAYVFASANDSPERFPSDWTLYGSNDGEEWTEVDAVTGAERVEEFFTESGIFECDAPAEYTNYKIHFTKNGTEGRIIYQISEFILLGDLT